MQAHLRLCGILPAGAATSAEAQATDLAWRLLLNRCGATVSGIALDWKKCYDHVSSVLLGRLADALGMPPGLAKPMLAAYGMTRHVLLKSMLAPAAAPARGLAAGCPRATDWLAIMSHVLEHELTQAVPGTIARPYVDDLTADIEHVDDDDGRELAVDAVSAMVVVVNDYAAAWHLEVNTTESRRFSTAAPVRQSLTLIPGWPVAVAFKDLGVVQTTTDRVDAAATRVRDDEAIRRLHKVEIIPLPLHVRALVAAASPWGVGSYGLSAQPISGARLKVLREPFGGRPVPLRRNWSLSSWSLEV